MNADNIFRRLRGAFGNALVWGAGWSALGAAVFTVLKVVGVVPASVPWLGAIVIAGKFGFIGAIAGGAFATVIGVLYRGRRLSEISWLRFGLGGAVVTGVFVPVFFQTMNWLSGDGFVPMALVMDDALWTAVFGGVAAGASLRIAQRADPLLPGTSTEQRDRLSAGNRLTSAAGRIPR